MLNELLMYSMMFNKLKANPRLIIRQVLHPVSRSLRCGETGGRIRCGEALRNWVAEMFAAAIVIYNRHVSAKLRGLFLIVSGNQPHLLNAYAQTTVQTSRKNRACLQPRCHANGTLPLIFSKASFSHSYNAFFFSNNARAPRLRFFLVRIKMMRTTWAAAFLLSYHMQTAHATTRSYNLTLHSGVRSPGESACENFHFYGHCRELTDM